MDDATTKAPKNAKLAKPEKGAVAKAAEALVRQAGVAPAAAHVDMGAGDGRIRAVVDKVMPVVDGGRYAAKCAVGEAFEVTVHAFTDGHDLVRVLLCWRAEGAAADEEIEMTALVNDVWKASFTPPLSGRYSYTAVAWVDHFKSWRVELARRVDIADVRIAAQVGAGYAEEAAARANGEDRKVLKTWAKTLLRLAADGGSDVAAIKACALDATITDVADKYPDRSLQTRFEPSLPLI